MLVSHSEVTQVAQSDMTGTKLGVDPELRSGLPMRWDSKGPTPTPIAQCELEDSQVSDEELPRKVSGGESKCTLEETDFPGNASFRGALRC